ncbi:DUF2975 domain-containing protein [Pseudoflavonifractor phocaeensis]|uniref:DUF2975 domain-containing protein n=1 Tax=Pseudoflavonifractor phocaeensis TaxID=1870988 RepID=UPI0025A3D05E|nr:DUF2975 domain-containing protein [Pseudoflavonifractor phocaeensis]MDM8239433.1 DUF2975 domain-containing protein [Pseudoflavonifractor phocaeensis]
MEHASVQKTAKVLRVLVLVVFVLNLLCLLLTPGATAYVADGGSDRLFRALQGEVERWMGQGEHFPMGIIFVVSWWAVWSRAETAVLTVFFWLCGVCTAVILWQAKKVLDTILQGNPFQQANARALKRAAVCCWIISGASLVRLVVWIWADGTLAPLFTYTTLFVPAFFMAGLLFLVMSALFGQAAELKEDQDLTI